MDGTGTAARLALAVALLLGCVLPGPAVALEGPEPLGFTLPLPGPDPDLRPPGFYRDPPLATLPAMRIERLFVLLREMRQRLAVTQETAFWFGQRDMQLYTYDSRLYELAVRWIGAYRKAIEMLKALPVTEYADSPERLVALRDAIAWGHRHAIAEPWYHKAGYRRFMRVLP